jgi:hypothetical protein
MKFSVDFPQPFPCDVRVDLSGSDVCVTEHRLDRPEVGASLKKMCRKRMPERMRMNLAGKTDLRGVFSDDLPDSLARQAPSETIQEQDAAFFPFEEFRSTLFHV